MNIRRLDIRLIREDTHKKSSFSGRTTKGVGRLTPRPTTKQKTTFFPYKSGFFCPKIWEKKELSKSVSGYYKTKKKKKVAMST